MCEHIVVLCCVKACLIPTLLLFRCRFVFRRSEALAGSGAGVDGGDDDGTHTYHLEWKYFYLNGARFFLFGQNMFDTFYRIESESESEKQHIALKVISPWNSISYGPTEAPLFAGCLCACVCCIAHTGKTFQNNNISTFYNISLLVVLSVHVCRIHPIPMPHARAYDNHFVWCGIELLLVFCVLPFCCAVRVCVCVVFLFCFVFYVPISMSIH